MVGVAAKALEDRTSLGIAMMLGAYFLFSLVDTSVKWLVLAGLPAVQLTFFRYVGHFAISLTQIAAGGLTWDRFATAHMGLVVLRGVLLAVSTYFNFIALNYLPLTVTSSIMFSAPIIVCLLSWPLLGDRVGPVRWAAILLGFCGVLVVIRPFGEAFHWATLLAAHNAVALAVYSILTRKLAGVVATETMQLYMGGIGTLATLPFLASAWVTPSTPFDWMLMIALGLWGWGGHEILTRAHSYATASVLMPYTYSFMLYLTVASFLVFGDLPDGWTILGAAIIVLSGLIIWARERRRVL
ncbi:MAG: DMT family transporter [Pseudomonadota bacterium]